MKRGEQHGREETWEVCHTRFTVLRPAEITRIFFLGGCDHFSLQLGSFAEYLWDHIFIPCPICCLRTLGPKPVCSQGRKCLLAAGIQHSASCALLSVNIETCHLALVGGCGPGANRTASSHPRAATLLCLHLLLQEGIS